MAITAKITARGLHEGVPTTIVFIEEDGTELENGKITFYKNGVKLKGHKLDLTDLPYADPDILKMCLHLDLLEHYPCDYDPPTGSIEGYWLALNIMYFDDKPEIEIEGDVNTRGSRYGDDDITNAIF